MTSSYWKVQKPNPPNRPKRKVHFMKAFADRPLCGLNDCYDMKDYKILPNGAEITCSRCIKRIWKIENV